MGDGFLSTFAKGGLAAGLGLGAGGVSVPGFSSSSSADSSATGGTNLSPWYQGDTIVAGGDARLDKAAIPGQGVLSSPALIVGLVVFGVVAWKRLSK